MSQEQIIIARLIKYLHELRADTKRIADCLGYDRVIQGATEEYADYVLENFDK